MNQKRIFVLFILLFVLSITACSSTQDSTDQMLAMVDEMEEALGEEWNKQSVTEVLQYELVDAQENYYTMYFCLTTYYEADPAQVTGLNLDAISAVFPPEEYTLSEEWVIEGHAAALYESPERSYLCWTSSPETTGIMEYTTGTISHEDAYRIAESVYIVPETEP